MDLLFVRHGQPDWGRLTRDPGLTELGHEQARAAAERLAQLEIDEVWVSPLVRARETAAPLLEALGREGQVMPWLREIGPPDVEGLSGPEIRAMVEATRTRTVADWHLSQRGSEAPEAFATRVSAGLDAALRERGARWEGHAGMRLYADVPRSHRVVAVCHAGTTAVAIAHLLGLPQVPWSWVRMYPSHASVNGVRSTRLAHGVIWGLRSFSDVEHLDPIKRSH